MGITGLTKKMKAVLPHANIKDIEFLTAGVDANQWLHQGLLIHCRDHCHGIHQDSERAENLAKAKHHEAQGHHDKAETYYKNAIKVTPSIVNMVTKALKENDIKFVVAPYEADAQLAHMAINKHVEVVISDDTDLMAYGCPMVMFKLEKGKGFLFHSEDLQTYEGFSGFNQNRFLEACILSGCDYLDALVGPASAFRLIRDLGTAENVIAHMKETKPSKVPENYQQDFKKAVLVGT